MIDPVQKAHTDRLTGIALMCGAVFLFAGNDATAKYLNGHMHTIEVVWARYMSASCWRWRCSIRSSVRD